jgi:hypothetical protein
LQEDLSLFFATVGYAGRVNGQRQPTSVSDRLAEAMTMLIPRGKLTVRLSTKLL